LFSKEFEVRFDVLQAIAHKHSLQSVQKLGVKVIPLFYLTDRQKIGSSLEKDLRLLSQTKHNVSAAKSQEVEDLGV
jgi:hypothetical protein